MKKLFAVVTLAAVLAFTAGNIGAQEAGGTRAVATQITGVTTGVAITGSSGTITTFTHAEATGVSATFTVTNPAVLSTNQVVLAGITNYAGTTGTPIVRVNNIVAGAFDVIVTNTHASAALNGVLKIGFVVY
jgi:hypothetical protein